MKAITQARDGLRIRDLKAHFPRNLPIPQRLVNETLGDLVDEQVVDYEIWDGGRIYFVAGKGPRNYARIIPSRDVTPLAHASGKTWLSALGGMQ